MRNTLRLTVLFAVLATMLLVGCGDDDVARKAEFEIGGPCMECPGSRLDSILKQTDGIIKHEYDKESRMLNVTYDSTKIKRKELIMAITAAGYDADLEFGLDHPTVSCCNSGLDVLSLDIDDDADRQMEAEVEASITEEFDQLEEMEVDISGDIEDFEIDMDDDIGDIDFEEDPLMEEFENEPLYKRLGDVDEDPKKKKK